MVNYGINYTLAQVGATSRSRPYGDNASKHSRSVSQEINGMNTLMAFPESLLPNTIEKIIGHLTKQLSRVILFSIY